MAKFDRIDGRFVAVHCTFHERLIFKRARWVMDPKLKRWVTPDPEKARPLAEYAIGAAREYLDNAEKLMESTVAASWAETTDAEFPAPEGLRYMDFQRAGIEYALKRQRTLIADPPGLGKSIMGVGIHNASPCHRVLIIPPASLKVNWSREWRRWDVHGLTVGIAMSIPRREPVLDEDGNRARDPFTNAPLTRVWTEHQWPDTDVVIVNYDQLETYDDQIKAQHWDLVIYDEAHLLKTATTMRSMCVFGGKKKARKKDGKVIEKAKRIMPIRATRHVFLTGTPILSKPVELWTLVQACDPQGLGRSWEHYTDRYCGAYDEFMGDIERRVVDGSSNLDELNRLLRERFMVRRDKKAVLKELPPKTRELVVLPQDKLEKPVKKEKTAVEHALMAFEDMIGLVDDDFNAFRFIDQIYNNLQAALDAQDGEEPDWNAAVKTLSTPEQVAFTEMSEAREEVALAKVGLVVDHVKKLVESEEPVILFAYHKSVIDALVTRLGEAGVSVGTITGSIPANKRQLVVDAFQEGRIDVVVGNILAMGVGFTMTRGRFVVFAELDWVPALIEQAEDRAWRNGQLNAVMVQHLVVDGSIEAMMAIRLLEKMGVIYEALDAISV